MGGGTVSVGGMKGGMELEKNRWWRAVNGSKMERAVVGVCRGGEGEGGGVVF